MSGDGIRARKLRANASDWAARVIEDATRNMEVPVDLIVEVASIIAGHIAAGQAMIDRRDLPRPTWRVLKYLEARGFIERDRDAIRPVRADGLPLGRGLQDKMGGLEL
jgi:hypothetical protein